MATKTSPKPSSAKKVTKPTTKISPKTKARSTSTKAGTTPHFHHVIILAQGAEILGAEAELRLRTVGRHIGLTQLPVVVRVAELPTTPMATGLALYQAFRATGRGGPALYVVGGAAAQGALSLLTTDWGNAVLAPNDGTLGLLTTLFTQRGIPFTLQQLALDSIITAEQHRMENPEWQPSLTFALRDVLAPAAAALLAGLPFTSLTQAGTKTNATGLHPHVPHFANKLTTLPLKLHTPHSLLALKQPDGSFLLNLTLDALSFQQLEDERAQFTLTLPPRHSWLPSGLTGAHSHTLHVGQPATSGHQNHGGLSLSGLPAPVWDEHFISLSVTCSHPCWADPIIPLTLTRNR